MSNSTMVNLSIGTWNIHSIRTDTKKHEVYGIMELLKLDLLVITESWLDKESSEIEMEKAFGDKFQWFSRSREKQRTIKVFGGVGILVRKSVGVSSIVRISKVYEIIWICVRFKEETLYIAAIYVPPVNSQYTDDFPQLLLELEGDILEFRQKGKVILMGDFNSRIGNCPSQIHNNYGNI
jgi:exonuclease III